MDEKPYTLIVDSPISDDELQSFQKQLQKKQEYLDEHHEQQHMLMPQENINLSRWYIMAERRRRRRYSGYGQR